MINILKGNMFSRNNHVIFSTDYEYNINLIKSIFTEFNMSIGVSNATNYIKINDFNIIKKCTRNINNDIKPDHKNIINICFNYKESLFETKSNMSITNNIIICVDINAFLYNLFTRELHDCYYYINKKSYKKEEIYKYLTKYLGEI